MPDERSLTDWITTNTEHREWTADDWRGCIERFKRHPGFEPPPYTVVHPAEFARLVAAGEIDENGRRLDA